MVKEDINSFLSPNLAVLYSFPKTHQLYSTLPSLPTTSSLTATTTSQLLKSTCRHQNPQRNPKRAEGHERSRSGPNTRRTKFAATARNLFWAWIAHANQPVRCAESTTGESVGERSRSRLSASRRGRLVVGFGKRWDRSLNLVDPWR